MKMPNLALLPVNDDVKTAVPAAMHELAAARYLGMNRTSFRELVFSGVIPYTSHINGKRRIYLRSDLDRYLNGLTRHIMAPRENSPRPAHLKGVGSK